MNLTLVVTHQCNLACPYCYAGKKDSRRMTWETAELGLELAFSGPDPRIDLAFFGGEPMLEWELVQRATAHAQRRAAETGKRLRLLLTTNGTRLTQERLDWLIEHDFFLGFSTDGVDEAMATTRPFKSGRSSFDAVEKGLDRLLATGYSRYEAMVVVDPSTAHLLKDTVDHLVARGVKRIAFNPNFFTPWTNEAKQHWEAGYRQAAHHYAESYRQGDPLYINFLDSKIITAVKGGFASSDHCDFGGGELAVAPSGNLYPCERLVGEDQDATFVIGNVHQGGLSPTRACAASSSCGNVDDECSTCPLQPRCMNWCGCTNYMETGAANRAGGNLCWHEKMAIPLSDEVGRTLYAEQNPQFLKRFYFEPLPEEHETAPVAMAV